SLGVALRKNSSMPGMIIQFKPPHHLLRRFLLCLRVVKFRLYRTMSRLEIVWVDQGYSGANFAQAVTPEKPFAVAVKVKDTKNSKNLGTIGIL
ncbi:MAG: hypothetical protein V7L29_20950, partial [Nostoc sp.]